MYFIISMCGGRAGGKLFIKSGESGRLTIYLCGMGSEI